MTPSTVTNVDAVSRMVFLQGSWTAARRPHPGYERTWQDSTPESTARLIRLSGSRELQVLGHLPEDTQGCVVVLFGQAGYGRGAKALHLLLAGCMAGLACGRQLVAAGDVRSKPAPPGQLRSDLFQSDSARLPERTHRLHEAGGILRGLAQHVHDLPVPPGEVLFGEHALYCSLDETIHVLEPVADRLIHVHVLPQLHV